MDYDISEPISQGSDEAQEAENRRIAESPMSSADFAEYMKRNLELAKAM